MNIKNIVPYLREHNTLIANHLIVLIAFFLTTSGTARTSGIFVLYFLLFFRQNLLDDLKRVFSDKIVLAFTGYLLLNYLWVIPSIDFAYSKDYIRHLEFLIYPALFLIYLDKAFIFRIISAFILGMFLSEILSYSLAFELIKHVPYGTPYQSPQDPSPFVYHMGYGLLLAFTAILLLQRLFAQDTLKHKIIYGLFFTTVTANVFMNAGRTGYALYILAITTFLLLHYKRYIYKSIPALIAFLLTVYFTAYNFSPLFKQRIDLSITSLDKIINHNNYNSSFGARLAMGEMAIEAIKDRPFIGHGTGTAVMATSAKAKELDTKYSWVKNIPFTNIDDQYLEVLVQFGIIGFLVFLNIFYQIFTYKQKETQLRQLQIILAVLLLFYSIPVTMLAEGMIPKFITIFFSFTLVTQEKIQKPKDVDLKIFSMYLISAVLLFGISKVT